MTTVRALRATELSKLFQKYHKTGGAVSWEDVLLDNANRVSTPLAQEMLAQMGLSKDTIAPFKMFENACGGGVVAPVLQKMIRPEVLKESSILCGDFSAQAVGIVKRRIEAGGWVNTTAETVDSQKTGFAAGQFTHVTTNIGYHIMPDSETALNETIRILQPGGILGLTTWHRNPTYVDDVMEAFQSFPFEAPFTWELQTTPWGKWADINWIRKTLQAKGLEDVKVDVLAHITHVESTDQFLSHFGMMIEWAINCNWPEELRSAHPQEEVMQLMRDFLDRKYQSGGWDLSWVSLIASGRVPLL